MTTPSDSIEPGRARAEAQRLSERQLRRLHAEGPAGMRPGAWDILDEEVTRRRLETEAMVANNLAEERYPALRTVIRVLRAVAVLTFVAGILAALVMIGGILGVLVVPRESSLIALAVALACIWLAITYWASGELISLLIDIEANTRALRHPLRTLT